MSASPREIFKAFDWWLALDPWIPDDRYAAGFREAKRQAAEIVGAFRQPAGGEDKKPKEGVRR